MATSSSLSRAVALVVAAFVLGPGAPAHPADWTHQLDADELDMVGFAGHVPDSTKPKLTAYFPRESYPVGGVAELQIIDTARDVGIQIVRAGTGEKRVEAHDVMTGSAMTAVRWIGSVDGRRTVTVRLGANWPSGFYFVRLT